MKILKAILFLMLPLVFVGCAPDGTSNYNNGVELQGEGKLDEAEVEYKSALKINPDFAEAYLNLGIIYLNKEWVEGGVNCFFKAISILERTKKPSVESQSFNETLSKAYNNLGVAQMAIVEKTEDEAEQKLLLVLWDEALRNFGKAVQVDPQSAEAQVNLKKFKEARYTYVEKKRSENLKNFLNMLQ